MDWSMMLSSGDGGPALIGEANREVGMNEDHFSKSSFSGTLKNQIVIAEIFNYGKPMIVVRRRDIINKMWVSL
jgi:hypothetical protein